MPENPCPHSTKSDEFPLSFEQPSRMSQKGMIFGMRARTRQRWPARPEGRCLAGLHRFAKGKIQTSWTARLGPNPAGNAHFQTIFKP
jgi:hypothetical protein